VTPVLQTITDDGIGNCMAACIASLLELPISEVPNFVAAETDDVGSCWLRLANDWLASRGFALAMVREQPEWLADGVPFIVSCESPRSTPHKPKRHAVIVVLNGWEMVVVHDPYPGQEQNGQQLESVYFSYLLVPRHAELTAARAEGGK